MEMKSCLIAGNHSAREVTVDMVQFRRCRDGAGVAVNVDLYVVVGPTVPLVVTPGQNDPHHAR